MGRPPAVPRHSANRPTPACRGRHPARSGTGGRRSRRCGAYAPDERPRKAGCCAPSSWSCGLLLRVHALEQLIHLEVRVFLAVAENRADGDGDDALLGEVAEHRLAGVARHFYPAVAGEEVLADVDLVRAEVLADRGRGLLQEQADVHRLAALPVLLGARALPYRVARPPVSREVPLAVVVLDDARSVVVTAGPLGHLSAVGRGDHHGPRRPGWLAVDSAHSRPPPMLDSLLIRQ